MTTATLRSLTAAACLFAGDVAHAQGIPVFDSSSFGQMILSVKALGEQLTQMQATRRGSTASV